jgi:hypothetical protein
VSPDEHEQEYEYGYQYEQENPGDLGQILEKCG